MGRAPCCEKVGLKKGRWTAEEDETLTRYIQAHGEGSWRSLPKNAGLLRCGKSCRLRWINYLRADLKRGNITAQEEDLIVQLHRSLGNRWSLIASHLPGRTDNEIKNYWNSSLSRKIHSLFRPTNQSLVIPYKRRVGRVSRSVAKRYNNKNTHHPFDEMAMTNQHDGDAQNLAMEQPTATTVNENPPMGLEQSEERDKSKSAVNLGPFEEMDDQIMDLNYMLESGAGDSDGIWNVLNEERENAVMGLDSLVISDERESGGWGSSSSPLNSCFGVEWDDQGFAMCDEGESTLLWPWDSTDDTLEVGELSAYSNFYKEEI